jgi:hypothetical protein
MERALRLVACLYVLVPLGCERGGGSTVSDTEGRVFRLLCVDDKCRLERSEAEPGGGPVVLHAPGRIVSVCDGPTGASSPAPAGCRALACEQDAHCPPLGPSVPSHCMHGLCQNLAAPVTTADSVVLCLAGTGAPENLPRQVERYALGLNCGNPCKVPATCRQP